MTTEKYAVLSIIVNGHHPSHKVLLYCVIFTTVLYVAGDVGALLGVGVGAGIAVVSAIRRYQTLADEEKTTQEKKKQ